MIDRLQNPPPHPEGDVPKAKVKPHGRFSWIWAIPIVAAGLVAYLAYNSYSKRGPEITLTFSTADGLQADQTLLKHKNVTLGTVEDISLASDMSHVIVKIQMESTAEKILTDHARFWVVRPRLSAGSLTGIDTLVSGAYIEVDPGTTGGKKQNQFEGLEDPPGRTSDEPGKVFVLKAERLGSLSVGAPIFYRDVPVGEVLSYDLGNGQGAATLRVFVRDPYSKFVHPETRFWNASGVSLSMGPEGLHVELESIQSVLSGGIAFETPRGTDSDQAADDDTQFQLYNDKATADAASFKQSIPYVTYFETSIQGLSKGSPVQLYGVQVGSVSDVKLVYDGDRQRMVARVMFDLQPERVMSKNEPNNAAVPGVLLHAFLETGMKVVLESSSMLTGAKDLSLEYAKDVNPAQLPKEGNAMVLPSTGSGIDAITAKLSQVADKVNAIPFEDIGNNLNGTLVSVNHLANNVDQNVTPALQQLPAMMDQMNQTMNHANELLGAQGYGANSDFQHGIDRTLNQVNDAARSFRVLADYLDRHPEALIRGRAAGDK